MLIRQTQGISTNNRQKSNVSFGCRLMAFAKANNVTPEDDEFRLSCLKKDDESLKNQSKIRMDKFGNASKSFDYEDLLALRKIGNMSGWGMLGFNKNTGAPFTEKGVKPAFSDDKFDKSLNNTIAKKSEVLFAHVRAASSECSQINLNNVHPYKYKNWGFMHNGVVPGALSKPVQDKLKGQYAQILGDKPKGTTDSESSFYYFMGKLQEKYNTTDTKKIGLENVKATFAESIVDLMNHSPKAFKPLDGNVLGVKGEMVTKSSYNFVASDGENILAFHRGPDLYLGMKNLKNGEKEYVISSEAITLDKDNIQWLSIPQNHMVVLSKDEKGNFTPSMTPLAKYTKAQVL